MTIVLSPALHIAASRKDNMGWSGWEEFGNLTTDDKTNLRTKK
jgi:hypothetical protein